MGGKGRYSPEQRQEDISLNQLKECLNNHGWPAEGIIRDLGEDLLVRVFDEGQSSGLSFTAQVKSTTSVSRFKIRGKRISYRLDVGALLHWEDAVPPVCIFVWDIKKRIGWWGLARDVIGQLDKSGRTWRSRRTARAHVLLTNSTSSEGLRKLRRKVADYAYPLVAKDKLLDIKAMFAFPKTPEGTTAYAALQDHFKTGKPVQIDGQFVSSLEFPAWWIRLYGPPGKPSALRMGPAASGKPVPAKIEVLPNEGRSAGIDYVEFRILRGGTEEFEISNEQQNVHTQFRFLFSRRRGIVKTSLCMPAIPEVEKIRDRLLLLRALASGGKLRITLLREGKALEFDLPPRLVSSPPDDFLEFAESVCLIQRRTGQHLLIPPDWSVKGQEIREINELAGIIQTGRAVLRNRVLSLRMTRDGVLGLLRAVKPDGTAQFRVDCAESQSSVLGATISLGPMSSRVAAKLEGAAEELRSAAAELGKDGTLTVKFIDAEAIQEFSKWLPDAKSTMAANCSIP